MRVPISGKNVALIAYITFVGLIVAYFLNKNEKNEFAQWHIKNMFGLVLFLFASVALQDYSIGLYVYWITVAFWMYSFFMALTNNKKAIPVLSEKFQQWFTFLD